MTWQSLLAALAGLALIVLLFRQFRNAARRKAAEPERIFGQAKAVLDDASLSPGPTIGSHRLTGRYQGLPVQAQTVVDTLNVRKLPSLWLMVTIPEPLPLAGTFDLMMRPSGPSTFSNFDDLPVTLPTPPDFPERAVIRGDNPERMVPAHVVAPHLAPFFGRAAKELLVAPKGLRMVVQLGEASRARYGVFRQAEFGDPAVDPALLRDILDRLVALRNDIIAWHAKTT